MRERLSVLFLIFLMSLASLMAGTPVINDFQSSKASQQVRLMDYLRLYLSASDPDGFPLSYEWTITQDPTAKAYFTSSANTTFVGGGGAELAFPWVSTSDTVNRPFVGQSVQISVLVKHANVADGPETTSRTFNVTLTGINHPPVPVITGTLGTPTNRIPTGSPVVATSGSSYDPDPGDSYRSDWTVGSGTGGALMDLLTIIGSEGSTMSFTVPNMIGNVDLQVILQLTDGMHRIRSSAIAYLKPADATPPVTGNTAPMVTVTTPVHKTVGETLILTGVVTDNDGDELEISCAWLQAEKAVSPTAITATPVAAAPPAKRWEVAVDLGPVASPGTFMVRLAARERYTADFKTAAADAVINVETVGTNQPPVARITYHLQSGTPQAAPESAVALQPPATIILDGTNSEDDGGSAALAYLWTITDNLTSGGVTLTNATTSTASLSIASNTQGTVTVGLKVTDQSGLNSSATLSFSVTPPKLTAKVAVKAGATPVASAVEEGTVITLDGSGSTASDGSKTHLTYAWRQLEGPLVSLTGIDSDKATLVAPGVDLDGTLLKFELKVIDTQTGETAQEQAIVTVDIGAIYFAQLGFGNLVGGEQLRSVLLLVNNTAQAANGIALEFYGSDGQPLPAVIDGQPWTNQIFSVPTRFSKRLEFGGMGDNVKVGWARVKSARKLNGLVLYQVVDSATQQVKREIPVFSSTRGRSFTTYFHPTEEMALAIANPSDQPVQITVSVVDYVDGQETVIVSKELYPSRARLLPKQHGARFIDSNLLGELPPSFKGGALRIDADGEIIVTALKTKEGVILSALPVAAAK